MRTISPTIQAVIDADYGETKDVVTLTIPATTIPVANPALTLYLANGEGITIDGHNYENKLRSVSTIKFSLGSTPDNAEIVLENVSRDMGFILADPDRALDGSEATIYKAFKVADGSWETLPLFVGEVSDVKVTQDSVTLSLVSDMSKRGTAVGNKTATQRCILTFTGPECGWVAGMPGNGSSCDHTINGDNGCIAHGNLQRVGAVPAFTTFSDSSGYDPNHGTGWGGGTGGGWCVHPDTNIMCVNPLGERYWVKAYKVVPGESVVSMDSFGNLVSTKVIDRSIGNTSTLYTINSVNGLSVSCSPSHPFITSLEDKEGTPCQKLEVGTPLLAAYANGTKFSTDAVASIEITKHFCSVILFGLEEPYHIYAGGIGTDGGLLFHNLKPAPVDPFFMPRFI